MNKKIKDILEYIEYYCWDVPKTWYYVIIQFFRNLKLFWHDLWNYRPWDFYFCNEIFITALSGLHDCLMDGHEIEITKMKKVEALENLIELLQLDVDNLEYSLYNKYHNIDKVSKELEKLDFKRIDDIARIIKGQKESDISVAKKVKELKKNHPELYEKFSQTNKDYEMHAELFDGTGHRTWWD